MEHDTAAKRLAELGNSTRLAIFRHLVTYGPEGCPVGGVQKALGIPGSTLSHHLGRLIAAGLVEQRREGRVLYCKPVMASLYEVIGYLTEECCSASCAV